MKINFLIVIFLFISSFVFSQQTCSYNELENLWKSANTLYNKSMYVSAQKLFTEILMHKDAANSLYRDDAAYYIALSALHLQSKDAELQINKFLLEYPESRNCNDANYNLANFNFKNKKYKEAIELYKKTDRTSLTAEEQVEYYFRLGFCYFARKDFNLAANTFYEVKDGEDIYSTMSLYFYSHIKYLQLQYQTALNGFLKLEKQPAFSSIAPHYIVQLYYLQSDYDALIAYAPKLLDTISGNRAIETNKLLGRAYYQKKQFAKAIPYLDNYITGSQTVTDFDNYELGFAYYQTQDYAKAATSFTKITNFKDSLGQNAAYHLGDCYLKIDKKVEARRAFDISSSKNYDKNIKEESLFNFAQLCFELSLSPFNEAIVAFTKYIEEYPNSPKIEKAYDYLVEALLSTKKYQDAISIIEKMPKRNSKIDAAYQRITYYRGLELFTTLKYTEAIAMFDKSLKYNIFDKTLSSLSFYWKAESYYRLNKTDEAISLFKEFVNSTGSVSLDEYSQAHYNLGYAYFNKKDYNTANTWFRKYEMQVGKDTSSITNDALNRIGDCYFIAKEFTPAANYYKKAYQIALISPDYTLYQLALSHGGLKQYKEKIWSLRKLINSYPKSEYISNAYFEVGRTYHTNENNADSAKYYYTQSISKFPNSSIKKAALSNLAAIYFNDKQYNEALETYKIVVSEYANSEEAASANEMIKTIYIELNNPNAYIDYANKEGQGINISKDEQDEIMWLAAKKLYIDKKYNDALNSLSKYISTFPTGKFIIEANYFKAELHFYFEEKTQAIAPYKVVADATRGPYTEESTIKLASLLYDEKNWSESFKYYDKLYSLSENKSTKLLAILGKLRTSFFLNDYDQVIASASLLIENETANEENRREALYKMAKSYQQKDNLIRALGIYEKLAIEQVSYEGAESKFHVAEINFALKKDSIAEDIIYEFAQSNTPQTYWLAKSFLLLSNIYEQRNDLFSAKHALQNILNNYNNETDGIKDEASNNLQRIYDAEQANKMQEELINQNKTLNNTPDTINNNDTEVKIELTQPAEIENNKEENE